MVDTSIAWEPLVRQRSRLLNPLIRFVSMRELGTPGSVFFPRASQVSFEGCDQTFVDRWLRPELFPALSEIYLLDYPNPQPILHRFPNLHPHIEQPTSLGKIWRYHTLSDSDYFSYLSKIDYECWLVVLE